MCLCIEPFVRLCVCLLACAFVYVCTVCHTPRTSIADCQRAPSTARSSSGLEVIGRQKYITYTVRECVYECMRVSECVHSLCVFVTHLHCRLPARTEHRAVASGLEVTGRQAHHRRQTIKFKFSFPNVCCYASIN